MSGRRNAVKVPLVILGVISDLFALLALAGGLTLANYLIFAVLTAVAIAAFVVARPVDPDDPTRLQGRVPPLTLAILLFLGAIGEFSDAVEDRDLTELWLGLSILAAAVAHFCFGFVTNRAFDVPPPERRLTSAHDALPSDWFDR